MTFQILAHCARQLPPFYVPDRMERDVHDNRVLKMRSVLWTAKEEDIRHFFRPMTLDRDGAKAFACIAFENELDACIVY